MTERTGEIRERLEGRPPEQWWSQAQAREDVAYLLAEVAALGERVRAQEAQQARLREALERAAKALDLTLDHETGGYEVSSSYFFDQIDEEVQAARAALAGTGAPPERFCDNCHWLSTERERLTIAIEGARERLGECRGRDSWGCVAEEVSDDLGAALPPPGPPG